MVTFVLMVQSILESLPSLSSTVDLLYQVLMVIYRGNILGILMLLLMDILILCTNNMDINHLTHHCHLYSRHFQKRT